MSFVILKSMDRVQKKESGVIGAKETILAYVDKVGDLGKPTEELKNTLDETTNDEMNLGRIEESLGEINLSDREGKISAIITKEKESADVISNLVRIEEELKNTSDETNKIHSGYMRSNIVKKSVVATSKESMLVYMNRVCKIFSKLGEPKEKLENDLCATNKEMNLNEEEMNKFRGECSRKFNLDVFNIINKSAQRDQIKDKYGFAIMLETVTMDFIKEVGGLDNMTDHYRYITALVLCDIVMIYRKVSHCHHNRQIDFDEIDQLRGEVYAIALTPFKKMLICFGKIDEPEKVSSKDPFIISRLIARISQYFFRNYHIDPNKKEALNSAISKFCVSVIDYIGSKLRLNPSKEAKETLDILNSVAFEELEGPIEDDDFLFLTTMGIKRN